MKFIVVGFVFFTGMYCAVVPFLPTARGPENRPQPRAIRKGKTIRAKELKCCLVGKKLGNAIELDSVCVGKTRTVFTFRCLLSHRICVYPERLKMTDSNSNRYKPLGINRIEKCPRLVKVPKGHRFQWYFEPLTGRPKFVEVSEEVDFNYLRKDFHSIPKEEWIWWHWEKVDLSQCVPKE